MFTIPLSFARCGDGEPDNSAMDSTIHGPVAAFLLGSSSLSQEPFTFRYNLSVGV